MALREIERRVRGLLPLDLTFLNEGRVRRVFGLSDSEDFAALVELIVMVNQIEETREAVRTLRRDGDRFFSAITNLANRTDRESDARRLKVKTLDLLGEVDVQPRDPVVELAAFFRGITSFVPLQDGDVISIVGASTFADRPRERVPTKAEAVWLAMTFARELCDSSIAEPPRDRVRLLAIERKRRARSKAAPLWNEARWERLLIARARPVRPNRRTRRRH